MAEDLINKVFSFISGDNEAEQGKQLIIKQFLKDLSQSKYGKFYRVKSEELDPAFGLYFYTLYRIIYPAQTFLRSGAVTAQLKRLTLEGFMGETLVKTARRLSPDSVDQRRKTVSAEEFSQGLKKDLQELSQGFSGPWQNSADKCFNMISVFTRLALFDYYSMLKKMAPEMQEGNFTAPPKFTAAKAEEFTQELDNFLSIINAIDSKDNWKNVLILLKTSKGAELVTMDQWQNLLLNFNELKQSKILELIVRLSTKNLIWEAKPLVLDERLTKTWLEQKSAEIEKIVAQIADNQRTAQKNILLGDVFEDMDVVRLNFYTPAKGEAFLEKDLAGFENAEALNHLLSFIQFYMNKEIQELCDILLVRGQWTSTEASREMSDAFHETVELVPGILELDQSLSPDGGNGSRLKAALLRVDRDRTQARYINSIVNHINEEALDIVHDAVNSLIVVDRRMKNLLDDYQKTPHDLIMNWKELGSVSKLQIGQRINNAYKKVNDFIQLMQLEVEFNEEE